MTNTEWLSIRYPEYLDRAGIAAAYAAEPEVVSSTRPRHGKRVDMDELRYRKALVKSRAHACWKQYIKGSRHSRLPALQAQSVLSQSAIDRLAYCDFVNAFEAAAGRRHGNTELV